MKIYLKGLVLLTLIAAIAAGCRGNRNKNVVRTSTSDYAETITTDAHNSQNSIDYMGTYRGILPCADCPGIQVELSLGEHTYFLRSTYLGRGEANAFEDSGDFRWNDEGNTITLDDARLFYKLRVGENYLQILEKDGGPIESDFADSYILRKEM